MKSIVTGLILAAVVCGLAYFLYLPKLKEQTHQEGYDKGFSAGVEKGKLDGITAGKEAQQKYADSLATAIALQKAADTPKVVKPVQRQEKVNYNVNYRVVGNKIVDPSAATTPDPLDNAQ